MRVLLDTCVLSELRKDNANPRVYQAVEEIIDRNIFISVVTVGEITKGISLLDNGKRKQRLHSWLQTIERHYADRIMGVDLETSRIWGELTALAQKSGRSISAADGLIAATARQHGLHVMTRNIRDFESSGTLLLNPWEEW